MHFAHLVKTSQIVEADESLLRKHGSRGYRCPTCGGRVSLRVGVWREPHFAHFPNEGSLECEDYHAGFGGGSHTYQRHIARPEVEDSADEAGLCLDDLDNDWSLYLRLPEIPNDELGAVSLSSLQSARVEICAGNAPSKTIQAIDLRPGVGSARVYVIPTSDEYSAAPRGKWPSGVSTGRWQLSCDGVRQIGTLFRFRRGEWVRLRTGSVVERGEKLCVVAHSRALPPPGCSPTPVKKILTPGTVWMMWRVEIPDKPVKDVEQWLEDVGHRVSDPAPRVRILSIPDSFDPLTRLPHFTYSNPIVVKVVAPYAGAKSVLTLCFNSNRISEPVNPGPRSREVFFEVSVAAPGEYSLEVDAEREAVAELNCHEQPKVSNIRRMLNRLPRLRLSVGGDTFEAWSDSGAAITIDRLKNTPDVSIDLGVERSRIDLYCELGGERLVRLKLLPGEAERLIKEALSKRQPGSLRVDAGALGSINIPLITPEVILSQPEPRITPWLACVSAACHTGRSAAVYPAAFRGTTGNLRLSTASVREVEPAAAMQIRALAKVRGRIRRRHKP